MGLVVSSWWLVVGWTLKSWTTRGEAATEGSDATAALIKSSPLPVTIV
jgi:hypothetical protein